MANKEGVRNHLQAEELASAMKTVAFYHSIWPALTTITVRKTNQVGYDYQICYHEQDKYNRLRQ